MPLLSPSRGLRCPRNHPVFLWEILQQSLSAHRQKVSPWTKAQYLAWSAPNRSKELSWPQSPKSLPSSYTHLRHLDNRTTSNFSTRNFALIPQNEHHRRGEPRLKLTSPETVFSSPSGSLNASQKGDLGNASRESFFSPLLNSLVRPPLVHPGGLVFNSTTSSSIYSPLHSDRTPPPSNYIPKSYSGQHKNYGNVSLLTDDQSLKSETQLPDSRFFQGPEASTIHRQMGKEELRTKLKTKTTNRWPLRPPSSRLNLLPRQSYVYPTSLTPTPIGSPQN